MVKQTSTAQNLVLNLALKIIQQLLATIMRPEKILIERYRSVSGKTVFKISQFVDFAKKCHKNSLW